MWSYYGLLMDYGFVLGYNSLYNSKSNANTHKLQIYRYKTLPENTKFVVKTYKQHMAYENN